MTVQADPVVGEDVDLRGGAPAAPDVPSLTEDDRPRGAGAPLAEARSAKRMLATVAPPLILLGIVLAGWYGFTAFFLEENQRFLMPYPHEVVQVGFLRWENLSEILRALWSTTQVAITGLVIAIAIGTVLAVVMSQAKALERSIYPYAVILQTIPIIALVPLIGFWFSFNFRSRVIVCVLISLFPIVTNTLFGLKSAEGNLHDLFTLHGASRMTRLRKLSLPAALPAIFTGFRISAGSSVIGAIVGDFFFRQGDPGIGRLLDIYRNRLESEELFTAIFFSSLLGLVVFWSFGFIANRLLRSWHDSVGH